MGLGRLRRVVRGWNYIVRFEATVVVRVVVDVVGSLGALHLQGAGSDGVTQAAEEVREVVALAGWWILIAFSVVQEV